MIPQFTVTNDLIKSNTKQLALDVLTATDKAKVDAFIEMCDAIILEKTGEQLESDGANVIYNSQYLPDLPDVLTFILPESDLRAVVSVLLSELTSAQTAILNNVVSVFDSSSYEAVIVITQSGANKSGVETEVACNTIPTLTFASLLLDQDDATGAEVTICLNDPKKQNELRVFNDMESKTYKLHELSSENKAVLTLLFQSLNSLSPSFVPNFSM